MVDVFLQTDIKPLVAKMIFDPNDDSTIGGIVQQLTSFAQKIPHDELNRYNVWLKDFVLNIESQDYVKVLQDLNKGDL